MRSRSRRHDEQPGGDRQHPGRQTFAFHALDASGRKQDRERVDEMDGDVEVLVGAMARRSRTQRLPDRETRRDERGQPDVDMRGPWCASELA